MVGGRERHEIERIVSVKERRAADLVGREFTRDFPSLVRRPAERAARSPSYIFSGFYS